MSKYAAMSDEGVSATEQATGWRPIEAAPRCSCCPSTEVWISRALFAIKREWGWEMWVGQCDAGDIWLGRTDKGACFATDTPTHWMPLYPPEC